MFFDNDEVKVLKVHLYTQLSLWSAKKGGVQSVLGDNCTIMLQRFSPNRIQVLGETQVAPRTEITTQIEIQATN